MDIQKIQTIIFLLLIIISLILSLTFTILKNSKRHSLEILNSLMNEMNKKPIFSLSKSTEQCSNYIIFGEFPGTKKGCDCLGIKKRRLKSYQKDRITKGSCTRNQTIAGCKNIKSIDSYNFNVWDSNYLCGDNNNNNYIYYLNLSVGEGENCPLNYKKCGYLDTLNNIMCIEEELDCPINKIIINNNSNYNENNKDIHLHLIEYLK